MQADERHVEPAHEEPDGEQQESLRSECLLQRVFRSLRDGRAGARAPLLAQAPGERHHRHRDDAEDRHGRVPIVQTVLQQRGEREADQPARAQIALSVTLARE